MGKRRAKANGGDGESEEHFKVMPGLQEGIIEGQKEKEEEWDSSGRVRMVHGSVAHNGSILVGCDIWEAIPGDQSWEIALIQDVLAHFWEYSDRDMVVLMVVLMDSNHA